MCLCTHARVDVCEHARTDMCVVSLSPQHRCLPCYQIDKMTIFESILFLHGLHVEIGITSK